MSNNLKIHFLDYMTLQRFSPHTKKNYMLAVQGLAKFYNQLPDSLSNEQIQFFILSIIANG